MKTTKNNLIFCIFMALILIAITYSLFSEKKAVITQEKIHIKQPPEIVVPVDISEGKG